jgi:selT/selW/selH-like putative selenoprotein
MFVCVWSRLIGFYGADVELFVEVSGVFEITVDGRLLFSKKQTGRFPTDEEVDALGAG